jgi:hypothetical protein
VSESSIGSLPSPQHYYAKAGFQMLQKGQLNERSNLSTHQLQENENLPEQTKRHKKSLVSKVFALVVTTSPVEIFYGPDQSFGRLSYSLTRTTQESAYLRGPPQA